MSWARLSLFALVVTACGGSTPREPAAPDATAGRSQAVEPAPDLSPVPAPEDLVVVGRLRDPAALLDTIGTWSGFPLDWRALIAREEPGLEKIVAWDAPVEAVVVLDAQGTERLPQPFAVMSVGVTSLDAAVKLAKARGLGPQRVRPGVYRLDRIDNASCALAAAVGRAPGRLVCGERGEDIETLLPYATRGLPNEVLSQAELYVELRVEPLRRRYGQKLRQLKTLALPFALKQMSLDSPRFDRALAEAAHAAADEVLLLSDDVRRASVEVSLRRDAAHAEATTLVEFTGNKSWTAGVLLDAAARSGPAPDAFWKLPASADTAGFDLGEDPKRYRGVERTLAELVGGFLEHEKAPRATVQRVVELAESTPLLGRSSLYAQGDLAAPQKSATDPAQRILHDLGWRWLGFAEPADAWRRWLDGFTRVAGDAALRRILEQRFDLLPGSLPSVKRRAARGMPPGSTTYEIALPADWAERGVWGTLRERGPLSGSPKAAPVRGAKPIKVVVVLVPDADRTWLGMAADEASLAQPLRIIRQGPDAERLTNRGGLEWLRPLKATSGGFLSLHSFARELASLAGSPEQDVRGVFDTVPHRARTAIPYATTVSRDPGLRAVWTLRVPKEVFADLAAVIPAIVARRGPPRP